MRILLTGANGQVGWEFARMTTRHELLALDRTRLDITDAEAVWDILETSQADLVLNAAAYTAVDRAEQEPDLAFAVNRDGPAHLATACARLHIPLVHLSTDYVFDGTKTGPYRENDPVAPLGIYGHSKWRGEEAIRRVLPHHLIVRVSWVFGIHGHNFVKTIVRLARQRSQLRVVADQHGCPTYAADIADVLLNLADRMAMGQEMRWGTYHYCGTPATTWYDFAQAIVNTARAYEPLRVQEIIPIATAEYPTPAARPANSLLDCTQLIELFGIKQRSWLEGLNIMLRTL